MQILLVHLSSLHRKTWPAHRHFRSLGNSTQSDTAPFRICIPITPAVLCSHEKAKNKKEEKEKEKEKEKGNWKEKEKEKGKEKDRNH